MKDVREKFSGVSDDELDGEMDLRRTGKAAKTPENERELEEMASAMYDFLYTSDTGLDDDGFFWIRKKMYPHLKSVNMREKYSVGIGCLLNLVTFNLFTFGLYLF